MLLSRLLRVMGGLICLSIVPIFLPLSWLEAAHAALGLGTAPQKVIFEYMARTLSAMYFAHGVMVLAVAGDVHRYRPLIRVVARLNIFLGILFLLIDCWAGMPVYWIAVEGPPIVAVGVLVRTLERKLGAEVPPLATTYSA
ncbi:MAG: hypothetical protein KatS3mg111_0565 [Pirellulaceae bacterium]|nr:MAG: hypothetical protein KatS3mg111_0565 [Pirellulaceae bacterium]